MKSNLALKPNTLKLVLHFESTLSLGMKGNILQFLSIVHLYYYFGHDYEFF